MANKLEDEETVQLQTSSGASRPEQELPKSDNQFDDKELERLAVEAILQETKQSKSRAERSGVLGWQRCPVPRANKRFLNSMVLSDVTSNKRSKTTPSIARDLSPKRDQTSNKRSKTTPFIDQDLSPKRDHPPSKKTYYDPPNKKHKKAQSCQHETLKHKQTRTDKQ